MPEVKPDNANPENQVNQDQKSDAEKNNPPANGAPLEESQKPQTPKGVKIDLFKQREAKRQANEQAELYKAEATKAQAEANSLKAQLEQMRRTPPPSDDGVTPPAQPAVSPVDIAAQLNAFENNLLRKLEGENLKKENESAIKEATKYLESRSHLRNDPAFATRVSQILDERYAGVSPMAAGKSAYLDACQEYEVAPDVGDTVHAQVTKVPGAAPLTPSSLGGDKGDHSADGIVSDLKALDPRLLSSDVKLNEMTKKMNELLKKK